MSQEEIDCFVNEGDVRCEVDGQALEMAGDEGEAREIVRETSGDVASLESCADLNEAYVREFSSDDEFDGSDRQTALGQAIILSGCPIPKIERDD